VQLVEVRRVSSMLLYCEQKFYLIDPELKRLDERQICQVNPQEDGLYTMYYDVVLLAKEGPDLDLRDGPVGETWHDRWRPTLRELVALLLEDMYPCFTMLKHREAFDGLLRAHLHMAQLLLKKEEGASASSPLQLQLPPPKEEATGVMEQQKKKETPQMARMAKVLEAAVVNALELIDVAVEDAGGGTTTMMLELSPQ
jgi:hypothetical protein